MSSKKILPTSGVKLLRSQTSVKEITWLKNVKSHSSLKRASTVTLPVEVGRDMSTISEEDLKSNPFLMAKVKSYINHLKGTNLQIQRQALTDQTNGYSMAFGKNQKVTLRDLTTQEHQQNSNQKIRLSLKLQNMTKSPIESTSTIEI